MRASTNSRSSNFATGRGDVTKLRSGPLGISSRPASTRHRSFPTGFTREATSLPCVPKMVARRFGLSADIVPGQMPIHDAYLAIDGHAETGAGLVKAADTIPRTGGASISPAREPRSRFSTRTRTRLHLFPLSGCKNPSEEPSYSSATIWHGLWFIQGKEIPSGLVWSGTVSRRFAPMICFTGQADQPATGLGGSELRSPSHKRMSSSACWLTSSPSLTSKRNRYPIFGTFRVE